MRSFAIRSRRASPSGSFEWRHGSKLDLKLVLPPDAIVVVEQGAL